MSAGWLSAVGFAAVVLEDLVAKGAHVIILVGLPVVASIGQVRF